MFAKFGKWLGLQIAAKAVSLALGLPIVAAIMMGALAYLQHLPLAYGFLAVLLAAAAVSLLMNQARTFMLAYSPINKVVAEIAMIMHAKDDDGKEGYAIGVLIHNRADVPMAFRVTREQGDVNGTVARQGKDATKGDIINAGDSRIHVIGLAVMASIPDSVLMGNVELAYKYGRPNNLSCESTFRRGLRAQTDAGGLPLITNPHVQDDA